MSIVPTYYVGLRRADNGFIMSGPRTGDLPGPELVAKTPDDLAELVLAWARSFDTPNTQAGDAAGRIPGSDAGFPDPRAPDGFHADRNWADAR